MSSPALPLPMRLFNAVGRVTPAASIDRFRLDRATVLDQARQKTGLSNFGPSYFEEGLDALLTSIEEDLDLRLLGQIALREAIIENLSNRLLLTHAHDRTPELFERPLPPPIIVTGLHRSGTTHLHRLLSQDPSSHAPPYWQLVSPLVAQGNVDHRRRDARRSLAWRKQVMPNLDRMHTVTADDPEECQYLTATSFESVFYWSLAPVTGYLRWYAARDRTEKYEEYRQWLQILQGLAGSRRLVLKAPEHLGALDALIRAVPHARIVQIQRDPVTAYASFVNMTRTTQALSVPEVDGHRAAQGCLDLFASELAANAQFRAAHPDRVLLVEYDDLLFDPVETVRGVYAGLGESMSPEFTAGLRTYIGAHPQGRHGKHDYHLTDTGVSSGDVRSRLGIR